MTKPRIRIGLATIALGMGFTAVEAGPANAVGQTCISNDGGTYNDGATNAAGTHKCRDGVWYSALIMSTTTTTVPAATRR